MGRSDGEIPTVDRLTKLYDQTAQSFLRGQRREWKNSKHDFFLLLNIIKIKYYLYY